MKKYILSLLILLVVQSTYAQCTVIANTTKPQITCGQSATLSHAGSTSGNLSFSEDFNNGTATGWAFTQQATFTNPCGNGPDNTPHLWMGSSSGAPRSLETFSLNFDPSVAPLGGTICFDMRFARQGGNSPCEGPDEPQEGVYIQYSINNGANWVTINYFNPNGGSDPMLINWNNWCFNIPAAALTSNVKFRWFQDNVSSAANDHWGIDNVKIIVNDPNVMYTWSHDGYSTNLPGTDPTPVTPRTTTTYTVTMTTSSGTCTGDVTIVVINPDVRVDAGPDLQVCAGECTTIQGTAKVINDPGGPKTFSNIQTQNFDASILGGAAVNVNVQDLNMNNVNPGSLMRVCISKLRFTGNFFSGVEKLSVTLKCPSGATIVLVPIGAAPAGSLIGGASYYENVCFVSTGAADISTASPRPITGTYNSSQPFSNVDGCTANGVWSINVATDALFGSGTFDGWSITFDDVEDSYTPNILWSPTTYMAPGDETTLTPTVCPDVNTTYTITASDTAGCVTVSDQMIVTTDGVCCQLQITNIALDHGTCGAPNGGEITISTTGQVSGLLFSIDGGITFQASNVFTGLNPGTYQIQVKDDSNCPVNRQATILTTAAPVITNLDKSDPTCSDANGSITVNATGGVAPLSYSINSGTPQSSPVFNSLTSNTYTVTVTAANNCSVSQSITLSAGNVPTITVNNVNPDCGSTNGTITIAATGGVTPLSYSIDGGTTTQSSGVFNNLSAGSYNIIVRDANGCQATQTVNLNTSTLPNINAGNDRTVCAGQQVTLTATGGATYSWTGGVTNGTAFTPTTTTTYTVTGVDANGCTNTSNVTITVLPVPIAGFTSDVTTGESPLTVQFTNISTNANNYSWDFGNGTSAVVTGSNGPQSGTFVSPGTYIVELTATNGSCFDVASIQITVTGLPDIQIKVPNVFTPNGDNSNDEFFIDVKNGKTIKVEIFNRWGNKMIELNDFNTKWNGKDANDGVYFFTYHITDHKDQVYEGQGHVTLIRK